jgi:hypothetical protein
MREQLAKQQHLRHAVDLIGQLKDLSTHMEPIEAKRIELALQGHLRLVSLYIPAAKEVNEMFESLGKTFILQMTGVHDTQPDVPALPAPVAND